MAQAGYVPVRKSGDKSGLWKIQGAKQVVYARKELSLHDQIKAVGEMIKQVEADAKARAEAEAKAKAHAKAQAQAEADAKVNERLRVGIEVKARARADAEAKRALSDAQRRALDLLTRCINDHGRAPPAATANELPRFTRVVSLDEWQVMCERGGLSSAPEKEERDRVFRQAKDALQTLNWIACLDGLVWICRG